MLFFMVFLIFCKVTTVTNKNAGSAIFNGAKVNSTCWSRDDIAKLQARKAFEDLMLPSVNPEKIDKKYIDDILQYFNNAFYFVEEDTDQQAKAILKVALCDTIGAHLRCDILPTVRFAYYAGYIPYSSARQIHDYYDEIKTILNTQGVGWKDPANLAWSEWSHLTVSKIPIGAGKDLDPCASLIIKRDIDNCIHLPSPNLDDNENPSAIALPFKNNGLISLLNPNAENTLLKYFTIASKCILHSSPANCRHADFVNFNSGLWHWMKRDVAPHLVDERLYAAYGGVFRIAAAVQSYGKGLTRRNLFEWQNIQPPPPRWQLWRTLTRSYLFVNINWSPTVYVILVLITALLICFLQICYDYMFGFVNSCYCKSKRRLCTNVKYSKMKLEKEFGSVHSKRSMDRSQRKKGLLTHSFTAPSSRSSVTHKVYDLNDNTEKFMAISMNNDFRDTGMTSANTDTDEEGALRPKKTPSNIRPKSPPKIETSIAELTIDKQVTPQNKKSVVKPMYSTSTLTRSEMTFCEEPKLSDSTWSVTSSSTSVTSRSSKSRSQRTRRSRDLAWARQVVSRHSQSRQLSCTELDEPSNATSPSRR